MNQENEQQFDQAISPLQHALDDIDIIRKKVCAYLQEIEQPIKAKRQELADLNAWKEIKQKSLNDLDEKIKQRQCELEWSGTKQEYVIRQLRTAIQTVIWEDRRYGRQRKDRSRYASQIQAALTRAINHRIDDLLEISRVRLSNGQINEYSEQAKESRRKLAGELRHARKRLRELKTIKSEHWRELESSERLLEVIRYVFAPVPPPLLDADQMNGIAGVPNKSGIYFLWEGPLVAYVGQSTNLAQRLLNHPRLQPNDKISYLCIDSSELFYHEAFYIGLCRPSRNGVSKVSKNRVYPHLGDHISDSPQ